MKKQILTLAICLTMTATAAMASSTASATMTATTKQTAPAASGCPCSDSTPSATSMTKEQFRQKMEERMAKHREALYCKLGLTPEQKAKAIEMDKKNRADARNLIDKVQEERIKLTDLKSKKACPVEILEQKQKLRQAKKALHKHFAASEKSFETILTKDQLAKFQAIREEHKAKLKKHRKCKGNCPCHKHPHTFEPPVEK